MKFNHKQQIQKFDVISAMKLLITIILSLLISTIMSQESKDYVIKLNKDTVHTKVVRINKDLKGVVCEENGKKIKYEAKDILEVKYDSIFYETGRVKLKRLGSRKYILLQRIVNGNLNLYEISVKRTKLSWRIAVKNFVTLKWIYRAEDARIKYSISVYFYKKANESRESLTKNWITKTIDCKLLHDRINSKRTPWIPNPRELVQFYNRKCN